MGHQYTVGNHTHTHTRTPTGGDGVDGDVGTDVGGDDGNGIHDDVSVDGGDDGDVEMVLMVETSHTHLHTCSNPSKQSAFCKLLNMFSRI